MAMPIYMTILKAGVPIVKGDVTARGHEGWIEVSSVSMGSARHGPNPAPGKDMPSVSDVVITKPQDSTSTWLFRQALQGEGVTVQIDFMKAAEISSTPYLTIKLQEALISSYQLSGQRGGGSLAPMESITLNFTKITFDTQGNGPDMSGHAAASIDGWNANKPATKRAH
jgi:type VI secretion system secreted protein Hcp